MVATAAIHNLTDTWNAGGTTFTAIKMNVTDTASAVASLLMDLRVGGVTKMSVGKNGRIFTDFVGIPSDLTGLYTPNSTIAYMYVNGGVATKFSVTAIDIQVAYLSWNDGDLRLYRDAANIAGLRNGASPQALRVYKSWTDAANKSYGFIHPGRTFASVVDIGSEGAGTGVGVLTGMSLIVDGGDRLNYNASDLNSWVTTSPLQFAVRVVPQASSPATLQSTLSSRYYTNEGASAEIVFNLPSAAAGMIYTFVVQDTDGLEVVAAAGDTIRNAAAVSAPAGKIESATIGNTVTLVAINATEWFVVAIQGTWTVT